MYDLDPHFGRYAERDPSVPVWNITRSLGRCTLRFYDTSPFSPSGRYLAVTRLPADDRPPLPGEACEIVLFDLLEGTHRVVGISRCWDVQLGAQVQWGSSDDRLYYNDMRPGEWQPFGVRHNPSTGETTNLRGAIYMVSPDGNTAASPCLLRTARTQPGYGGVVPPEHLPLNVGASKHDGLYLTDLASGECRLHVSLHTIAAALDLEHLVDGGLGAAAFYGFHVKWSPDGKRLMFVIRNKPEAAERRHPYLVTMNADGSGIRLALGWDVWSRGGHHPNWCPCGLKILMNLADEYGTLRFYTFNHDGSERQPVSRTHVGSGHPTIAPSTLRHLLTDAYLGEKLGAVKGVSTPIRLLDLETDTMRHLIDVDVRPTVKGNGVMRIDPHPAWHPSQPYIAFNARHEGTRNVFVADLRGAL